MPMPKLFVDSQKRIARAVSEDPGGQGKQAHESPIGPPGLGTHESQGHDKQQNHTGDDPDHSVGRTYSPNDVA